MPPFDMNEYLNRRFSNSPKQDAIQNASIEKTQALEESSWAKKLELDPEGVLGSAVNLAASLASGTTRLVGHIGSLPTSIASMQAEWGVPDEAASAYARTQQGIATPEDAALLQQRGYAGLGGEGPTLQEQLQQGDKFRGMSRKMVTDLDTSSIVDQTKRQALAADLGDGFDESWNQVKTGYQGFKDGHLIDGTADTVTGIAKLLFNAGEAAANNPGGVAEYVAENLPQLAVGGFGKAGQLAMLASNAGYGADLYQQGIQNYQKEHNGALPPAEERQRMAMYAASASLAEEVGDVAGLGFMKKAKGLPTDIRTGFKESILNIGKAAGKGLATEAPTEGYQTFAEGEATGKEATAEDIYTGTVIGGLSGGVLSGGGRALAEGVGATPQHAGKREQARQDQEQQIEAIQTGDVSGFLDPKSRNFDPTKAVASLFGNSQLEDATPEAKAENLKQATKIITDLENQRLALYDRSPEGVAESKQYLAKYEAQLAKAKTPEEKADLAETVEMFKADIAAAEQMTPAQQKANADQLAKLDQHILSSRQVKDQLEQLTNPVDVDADIKLATTVPDAQDTEAVDAHRGAVDRVLTLSMASPHLVSEKAAKALADNPDVDLTEAQRTHLRVFSEARAAENALKTMKKVSQDIYFGSNEKGKVRYLGIKDYNAMMGDAIATGNQSVARKALAGLASFARNHQSKLATAEEAARTVKGRPAQITMNKATQKWEIAPKAYSWNEMRKLGGLTLNSPDLLRDIGKETEALNKATAALKSAYKLKFAPSTQVTQEKVESPVVQPESTASVVNSVDSSVIPSVSEDTSVSAVDQTDQGPLHYKETESIVDTQEASTQEEAVPAVQATEPVVDQKETASGIQKAITTLDNQDAEFSKHLVKENFSKLLGDTVEAGITFAHKVGAIAQAWRTVSTVEDPDGQYDDVWYRHQDLGSAADALVTDAEAFLKNPEDYSGVDFESFFDGVDHTEEDVVNLAQAFVAGQQPTEVVVEEQVTETEASEESNVAIPEGTLVAVLETSPEGTPFQKKKLGDFITQVAQRSHEIAARPLVAVKDFLSKILNDEVSIMDYLEDMEEGLSVAQDRAMRMFVAKAQDWAKVFQKNTIKLPNKDFYYKDLMQFLIEKDPETNVEDFAENVKTAMSLAAFKAIIDAADASPVASPEQINKMLLRDEDHPVTTQEYALLARAGVRENVWRNSVGRTVVQALGFKALKDAPLDMLARLESGFGAHIEKMLLDQKILTLTPFTQAQMTSFMEGSRKKKGGDAVAKTNFLRLAWVKDPKGLGKDTLPKHIQEIVDSYQGSRDILDKLFSVESENAPPSLEPIPLTQNTTSGTKEGIPANIKAAIEEKQRTPLKMRPDMHHLMTGLSDDIVLQIAGLIPLDSKKIHITNRDGIEAKNRGLTRELVHYRQFLAEYLNDSTDIEFFITEDAWVNQRVGSGNNWFSLQTSKLHRHLAHYADWETKIALDDTAALNHFKLRVAEGMGIKTDREAATKTLSNFDALFNPDHEKNTSEDSKAEAAKRKAAVDVLVARIGGATLTPEQEGVLLAGVMVGGEKMHSLDSLMGMAQYQYAKEQGFKEFTTYIVGEVDGVANGPILAQLLMGAASSVGDMLTKMQRGGMFTEANEEQNYNLWRGQPGRMDQYEAVAKLIRAQVRKLSEQTPEAHRGEFNNTYQTIERFTGVLEHDGKVLKHGRNVVKTTLTPLMYGSALETSINSMANKLIENVYERIEKAANGENTETAAEIVDDINALIEQGSGVSLLSSALSLDQLLKKELAEDQIEAIKTAFNGTLGRAVRTTIKENFSEYLTQRDNFNRVAQVTFDLYDSVYKGLREEYLKELIQAEKDKPGTGIAVDKAGNPRHDMNAAQLAVLEKRIAKLKPMMHTTSSKLEGKVQNGVFLGKHTTKTSDADTYASEVHFPSTTGKNGNTAMYTHAEEKAMQTVGVSASPLSVHSLDSGISNDSRTGLNVVNVHDAEVVGLNNFLAIAKALNKNTFKHLLNYSPMLEGHNALLRMVQNLSAFMEKDKLSPVAYANLNRMLEKYAEDQGVAKEQVLEHMLVASKMQSYQADSLKLDAMAEFTSVDQYAAEGGNHVVTDEERAAARKARSELSEVVSEKDLEKAKSLTETILKNVPSVEANKVEMGTDEQKDTDPAAELNTLSLVQIRQLLKAMPYDGPVRKSAYQVLKVMSATNSSFMDAANKALAKKPREALLGNLLSLAQSVQGKLTKGVAPAANWGTLGKSPIESDPLLVQYFERASDTRIGKVIAMLETRLKEREQTPEVQAHRVLLQQLKTQAKAHTRITMVTPTTMDSLVLKKPDGPSRAWYVNKTTKNGVQQEEIYFLSPDYIESGLTVETLIHEMTHSVVANLVAERSKDAEPFIQDLEALLKKAQAHVKKLGKEEQRTFAPMVSNVQELIAWGMSNTEFQDKVLKQITFKSKTQKLVEGMKGFIDALVGILFRGASTTRKGVASTGMLALVNNVSGLMALASEKPSTTDQSGTYSQASVIPNVMSYDTLDIYQALDDGTVDRSFDQHLRNLLSGMVQKLHGVVGTLHDSLMKDQALTAKDVWLKAMATNQLPFASSALNSGFKISEQEAFVIEQVEATVRASLEASTGSTTMAYSGLVKLYNEVRSKLDPEGSDFYEEDWAAATPDEKQQAKALYDFIFKMEKANGDRSDYLARFAALGLAHNRFNNILRMATDRVTAPTGKQTFVQRLERWFEQAMNLIAGRLTKTHEGQAAGQKLNALVGQLVDIEAKRRARIIEQQAHKQSFIEKTIKTAADKVRAGVVAAADSGLVKNSKSGIVRATGAIAKLVANDRVESLMNTINTVRDTHFKEAHGVLLGIVNEVRGANDTNKQFHVLLREAKRREGIREDVSKHTEATALGSFKDVGEYLTKAHKDAITAVFLRTDMASLLDKNSLSEMQTLMNQPKALEKAIQNLEGQLVKSPHQHFYTKSAKTLGYYLATGKVRNAHMLMNAKNIAGLIGTGKEQQVTSTEAQVAEAILEQLITLRALQHVSHKHMKSAREVMAIETARGNESGVEMVLRLHQAMQKQSKERLFQDNEALMVKGYVPEIYNPNKDLLVATAQEGIQLLKMGYTQNPFPVGADPRDPDQTERFIYTRPGGGLRSVLTGIISYTGKGTKGSRAKTDSVKDLEDWKANRDDLQIMFQNKQRDIQDMFNPDPGFDPSKVEEVYAAPVVDGQGGVMDYRYLMHEENKDSLLDRDNRFDKVLGRLAGGIYDKETTQSQNHKAVQALKDQFDGEYSARAKTYVKIGPDSPNKEFRDIYNMLPDDTKDSIKEIWGKEGMMIRQDLLDINFGYRKQSIASVFDKDSQEHNFAEHFFVDFLNYVLGEKAAWRVQQAEDIWQALVHEIKDILVVKSFSTLKGNVLSNASALLWFGVSPKAMLRDHRIALKGATAYRKDSAELQDLRLKLGSGYVKTDRKEMERRVLQLEDSLARNPVRELIDAGLMPTIVEDVSSDDDLYSYKSRLVQWTEEKTQGMNPGIKSAVRTLYMAHDTKFYQTLSHATRLSDFLARYTLYQHVTTRKENPLSKEEAVQLASDAFINYDVPSHRTVQYMNDMGFVWFTKYYLRIQKIIASLYKEKPGRAIAMLALEKYLGALPTLMDSSFVHRLYNPLSDGALKYPGSLGELATVKMLMSPFSGAGPQIP